MKLWIGYTIIQVAILAALAITQPLIFICVAVALPISFWILHLVAKYLFGISGDEGTKR
jgi:cobalamin synthase